MSSIVSLICRGTAWHDHGPRIVAQFRHDDGWARIHPRGRQGPPDPIFWGPDPEEPKGKVAQLHIVRCSACKRTFSPMRPETLYPLLDIARERGGSVPLR